MNMSLMAIMRDDPNIAKRLEQRMQEVRENKKNLMKNAAEYSEIYHEEIEEGTKKKQLLLTDGKKRGLNESDVLKEYGKFIPTKETPILNFLHFLMRDGDHPDWMGIHKKLVVEYGHTNNEIVRQGAQAVTEDDLDQIFGIMVHEEEQYANVQEPQEMDRFIYGSFTHELFIKIKKLKALTQSKNKNEAIIAYRLALRLCEKYGLEFDKIPQTYGNDNDQR